MPDTPSTLPPAPRVPVQRSLASVGKRRQVRVAGIRFTGRRRRPSGERAPLPHELQLHGRLWLVAGLVTVAVWTSLFLWPETKNWWQARDLAMVRWFVDRRTELGVDLAQTLHALGSPWVWRLLRWALLAYLAVSRRWRHLLVTMLVFLLLETAIGSLTSAIGRPRPYVPLLGDWTGYSHPSAAVASLAATLAVAGMVVWPAGRRRHVWMAASAVAVALCGLSRIYLGVDHPTDVVISAVFAPAVAVVAVRWLAPESVFPVRFRRGASAHLDISGRRGLAIREALHDQLGLDVLELDLFGTEASGGSTPLRIRVAGEDGDRLLFGKLYSTSHLRADRWYKAARTILYGSLEDEVRYTTVRRLVEREDHMLRVMVDAGIPSAQPLGIVEITPEREYLLVTEFLQDAEEITVAEVDDDVIDQGLLLVRRLWDAGLAHRDIKPANVLVKDGHLRLIDVSFGMIRPSPWRQAVDLANMMIILALRTDPDRVYARALQCFAAEDIAEAFAATRSVTIPSQSRSSLKLLARREGLDIVERFRELAPHRDPISIQRWSRRRIGLTLGALLALFLLLQLLIQNLSGQGFL